MKTAILLMSLLVSANSFAYSFAETGISTSFSPFSMLKSEAEAVSNDVQELMQGGTASPLLESKIAQLQDEDKSISDAEALDILIEQSNAILAK